MDIRLLALDLDGTLTNSEKIITPRTREALMEAQKRGIRLVLASGRPTEGISPLAEELEMGRYGGFILSYNGAEIREVGSGRLLVQQTLPADTIPVIAGLAREYGIGVLSYGDGAVITEHPDDPYIQLECRINRIPCRPVENFEKALTHPVPKCLMTGEGDYMGQILPRIQEALPGLSVYRSEAYFIEIMPQGIDKARSLAELLRQLNLTASQLAACGDGYNDISMIAFAGLGVAMANARPEVQKVARVITTSNDEDGVAEAVYRWML